MREQDRQLMESMQAWTPDEIETFTQELMVQNTISREMAEEWITKARAAMEEPVDIGSHKGVVLPVDVKVGANWGRYHRDENPEGLRKP